jgi:hypothetical protein
MLREQLACDNPHEKYKNRHLRPSLHNLTSSEVRNRQAKEHESINNSASLLFLAIMRFAP